jgi:hypothetical protein
LVEAFHLAAGPNERWQADFTHWWLAGHTHVETLAWLDDHARRTLSVTAHRPVTPPVVLAEFRKTVAAYGVPAAALTDNGMVFITRLSGGKGGREGVQNERRRLGVVQPHHCVSVSLHSLPPIQELPEILGLYCGQYA